MWESLPLLLSASVATVEISIFAIILAAVLGLFLGLIQVAGPRPARVAVRAYVTFMRGVPLLVVIFLVYFGLPGIGLTFSAFLAGIIALGLNSGAFVAEIVRAGLSSIAPGQSEAARSIGLSDWQTAMSVLLPQSVRRIVPPMTNEFSQLVKGSSLLSAIGVYELTRSGQTIIARTFTAFEIYLEIAALYLVLVGVLSVLSARVERSFA